jgi:hypothetical protein
MGLDDSRTDGTAFVIVVLAPRQAGGADNEYRNRDGYRGSSNEYWHVNPSHRWD